MKISETRVLRPLALHSCWGKANADSEWAAELHSTKAIHHTRGPWRSLGPPAHIWAGNDGNNQSTFVQSWFHTNTPFQLEGLQSQQWIQDQPLKKEKVSSSIHHFLQWNGRDTVPQQNNQNLFSLTRKNQHKRFFFPIHSLSRNK